MNIPYTEGPLLYRAIRYRMPNQPRPKNTKALLCDTKAAGTSTAGTLQRQSRMREVMKYISPEYWDEIDALIRELDLEFVGVTRIYNEDKSPKNEYDERKK